MIRHFFFLLSQYSFLLLTLILLSGQLKLLAQQNQSSSLVLTKCLGQEELKYHKEKDKGWPYKLNQKVISLTLQFSRSLEVNPQYLQQICQSKLPSLSFLELMILKKDTLQSTLNEKIELERYSLDQKSIQEFKQQAFEIYLELIALIQSELKTPGCLKQYLPFLKESELQIHYLEETHGIEKTLKNMSNTKKFFDFMRDSYKKELKCS